jgi:HEAT repeat protein
LVARLDDPDQHVRQAAREALGKICPQQQELYDLIVSVRDGVPCLSRKGKGISFIRMQKSS